MGGRVLVIEDEPNIVEAISFVLARDGWQVTVHSDGAGALEALRAARLDVLVLDVMLPGRSGYEILAEMRALPEFAALPVLILTAKGRAPEREAAQRAGANRILSKPFANADLLSALRDLRALA